MISRSCSRSPTLRLSAIHAVEWMILHLFAACPVTITRAGVAHRATKHICAVRKPLHASFHVFQPPWVKALRIASLPFYGEVSSASYVLPASTLSESSPAIIAVEHESVSLLYYSACILVEFLYPTGLSTIPALLVTHRTSCISPGVLYRNGRPVSHRASCIAPDFSSLAGNFVSYKPFRFDGSIANITLHEPSSMRFDDLAYDFASNDRSFFPIVSKALVKQCTVCLARALQFGRLRNHPMRCDIKIG